MDEEGESQIPLPFNFEEAEVDHLVILIGDMLARVIQHNDRIPLRAEALTRFHSKEPPAITLMEYLRRIVRYTRVERSCLLILLHYIDQICARMPAFTISSLTVHRFLITALAVSSKALCDAFCTNVHYAKVGGIRVVEFNYLEREFLSIIDWRLTCQRETLHTYYVNLIRTHSQQSFKLLDPPDPAPTSPEHEAIDIETEDHIPSSGETVSESSAAASGMKTSSTKSSASNLSISKSVNDLLGVADASIPPTDPSQPMRPIQAALTGLVPSSSTQPPVEHHTPPRPTLEQNMAFASLLSSSSDIPSSASSAGRNEPGGDMPSRGVTKRIYAPSDDSGSRPPTVRRRLDGETPAPSS